MATEINCLGTRQVLGFQDLGGSIVMGVPQNGWFISGNPIRMDDLGVPSMETPISTNGDKWWIVFEIEDV